MRSHQAQFSAQKMAEILNVSRSGYYRPWKDKKEPYNEDIHQIFKEHKGRYGPPRIHAELIRRGIDCSLYQVEKRMKELGLYSGRKKRKPKTTIGILGGKDLLKRNFRSLCQKNCWMGS